MNRVCGHFLSSLFSLLSFVCSLPSSTTNDSLLVLDCVLASERSCEFILLPFFLLASLLTIVPERPRQSLSIPTCRPERAPSSTSHTEIFVKSACMELLRICLLPLPPSHPFAKFVVFFCHSLLVFQITARPPLFPCFLCVQLAFFVAVGVLLASARATESLFVF